MKKKSTKKPRTVKKPKTVKKLQSLSQTHGKEETDFKPTTLNQIWGDDGVSKYGTLDEKEYKQEINEMHFSDLRTHAANIGLVPIDDRELLTKRVVSEFRRHVNEYRIPNDHQENIEDVNEEAKKMLEEGK